MNFTYSKKFKGNNNLSLDIYIRSELFVGVKYMHVENWLYYRNLDDQADGMKESIVRVSGRVQRRLSAIYSHVRQLKRRNTTKLRNLTWLIAQIKVAHDKTVCDKDVNTCIYTSVTYHNSRKMQRHKVL